MSEVEGVTEEGGGITGTKRGAMLNRGGEGEENGVLKGRKMGEEVRLKWGIKRHKGKWRHYTEKGLTV